jgi:PAS domain-containing protein
MSRREAAFTHAADELFSGPGPSRAALRAVDWDATPLGEIASWPVDLLCTARTVVAASTPMVLWWGDQFHQVHNDALIRALGDEQPVVGRPAKECWPERWEVLGPAARLVLADVATVHLDEVVLAQADGAAVHWTMVFGPLSDDERHPAGVLATAVDVTARVAAHEQERRNGDETVANLRLALASSRRIGTAIGIVMAHRRITDEAAFDLLRQASQRAHRKVRDIADEVVQTGVLPEPS